MTKQMQLEGTSRPLLGIPECIPFLVLAKCELVSTQPRELFAPIVGPPGALSRDQEKRSKVLSDIAEVLDQVSPEASGLHNI